MEQFHDHSFPFCFFSRISSCFPRLVSSEKVLFIQPAFEGWTVKLAGPVFMVSFLVFPFAGRRVLSFIQTLHFFFSMLSFCFCTQLSSPWSFVKWEGFQLLVDFLWSSWRAALSFPGKTVGLLHYLNVVFVCMIIAYCPQFIPWLCWNKLKIISVHAIQWGKIGGWDGYDSLLDPSVLG